MTGGEAVARRPKAADIGDEEFLAALDEVRRRRGASSASRWDIGWVLSGHPGEAQWVAPDGEVALPLRFPEKVVLAKAQSLIRRGLIIGCGCGCRGDFERTG